MEIEIKSIEDDNFPDEFQCCVCLDLLYKPVVLACGHMACFWCMYHTMDIWQESHCPLCRDSFNHFPRFCTLLFSLLFKLYPLAHERREKQVAEEEKISEIESQPFNGYIFDLKSNKASDAPGSSSNSSQTIETADSNVSTQKSGSIVEESSNGTHKMVDISDFTCAICKQLIYRPVVLNCGDVFCEACIINSSDDKVCKCVVCQSPHPNGLPHVCLILDQFLEEQFPLQYSARKESLTKRSNAENQEKVQVFTNIYASYYAGQVSNIHVSAGCDYCGMYPIIGERYSCKDCKEKIGFDLCEGCYKYNSRSKLPGRFNQQHTEDHQFEIVQQRYLNELITYSRDAQADVSSISNTTDDDDTPIGYISTEDLRIYLLSGPSGQ